MNVFYARNVFTNVCLKLMCMGIMKLNFCLRVMKGKKLYCDNVDGETFSFDKFKKMLRTRLREIVCCFHHFTWSLKDATYIFYSKSPLIHSLGCDKPVMWKSLRFDKCIKFNVHGIFHLIFSLTTLSNYVFIFSLDVLKSNALLSPYCLSLGSSCWMVQ